MGRIPGAPTHLSSSVVSVRMLRKQGEVWVIFWGLGRATPGQHSRGLHSSSSVFGYLLAKDFQRSGQKRSSTIFQSGDREESLGLMECSARKQQREDFSSHKQKQFPDLGKGSFSGCPSQHCGFGVWEFLDIALLSRRGLWFSLSPGFGISWIPGGFSKACLKYREQIRVTLKIHCLIQEVL